ncbi:HDOD domain-containing protein [Dechloromonas sp.]|uniref:HDOD domain-containing protein n=1 Tax=Dechloromonas sp. TaxID=1917218 RepID=UPI00121C5F95|nr:HDOD domain-containing protein [Dechloromonas sp.]MBU3695369.1 HDOD domain-containing protein [Dechloromonas sp.]TEX48778.1 MAG: hypothetical protein CFR70_05695 [Rhodocyclaceae bacterium]
MKAPELSIQSTEQLLKGIVIPPRPTILQDVDSELNKPDTNLITVAALVAKDVGLSASILKTLNSPFFGLSTKVSNVSHAIQLLGAKNLKNIVTGLVLRTTFSGQNLERFWDTAEKVASINALICTRLPRMPKEDAYLLGLFHDVGLPMLMQRIPEYRETLKQASSFNGSITDFEEQQHATNHATVGFIIARSWGVSDSIAQAILYHHAPHILGEDLKFQPLVQTLVAVNFIGEHLHESALRMRSSTHWETYGDLVCDYLGLSLNDFAELEEDVCSLV